jgi:hypothetical protein
VEVKGGTSPCHTASAERAIATSILDGIASFSGTPQTTSVEASHLSYDSVFTP